MDGNVHRFEFHGRQGLMAQGLMFSTPTRVQCPDGEEIEFGDGWCRLLRVDLERNGMTFWESVDAAADSMLGVTRTVWLDRPGPWESLKGKDLGTAIVYPIGDLIRHDIDEGASCLCMPRIESVPREDGTAGVLYVHSSVDGRELQEGKS